MLFRSAVAVGDACCGSPSDGSGSRAVPAFLPTVAPVPATDTADTTDTAERSEATLLDRVTAAGISEARAREHIGRGVVHLQGEVVTDPDAPAPWPAAWFVGSDR